MLRSPAWRALSPVEKVVLLDLWQRHNGINNGQIVYGVRDAEKIGVTKSVAALALERLVELGFLRVTRNASFRLRTKEARTWALTAKPFDERVPTKDFMRWLPDGGPPRQPSRERSNGHQPVPSSGIENLFLGPSTRTNRSLPTDQKKGHLENAGNSKDLLGGAGGGQNRLIGTPQKTAKNPPETAENNGFLVLPEGPMEGCFGPSPRTLLSFHAGQGAEPRLVHPNGGVARQPVRFGDKAKAERTRRFP
jgi:hypothetical protein